MDEMDHTDPALVLRIYGQSMRRDEGEKQALRALSKAAKWQLLAARQLRRQIQATRRLPEQASPACAGLSGAPPAGQFPCKRVL
jgi:hypothetical protein